MNIHLDGTTLWAVVNEDNEIQQCILDIGGKSHMMPMVAGCPEALGPMLQAAEQLADRFSLTLRLLRFEQAEAATIP